MKVYIYPTYTPSRDKSGNLYIKYFHDAFHHDRFFSVKNRLWQIGITSLFFNLDADVFVIQWVDLIPFKKFGKIQFVIFLILIKLLSCIKSKRIVWILHNKHAHNGKSKLVDYGMNFIAKYSYCVVTHSDEGVTFFNERYPQYKGKCHYIPHPVYSLDTIQPSEKQWDYIIWGGISRRKRILEFLNFAKESSYFDDKKILICGNCSDKRYDEEIKKLLWDNVTYINRFVADAELRDLICKSGCILFTYNVDSLLSSGALIYSLNFCKPIIGPNSGNFYDLKGIVSCYDGFEDIPSLTTIDNTELIRKYIIDNTWAQFPDKLRTIIDI